MVVISVLRIYIYDAIDNGYSHHRHEDAGRMKLWVIHVACVVKHGDGFQYVWSDRNAKVQQNNLLCKNYLKLIFEVVFNDIAYSEMCGELGTKEGALAFYYKIANRLTL